MKLLWGFPAVDCRLQDGRGRHAQMAQRRLHPPLARRNQDGSGSEEKDRRAVDEPGARFCGLGTGASVGAHGVRPRCCHSEPFAVILSEAKDLGILLRVNSAKNPGILR